MRRMLITLLCLNCFLICLTGCGSAHKTVRPQQGEFDSIKSLAVVVKQEKEFEVVYSRATADGTGAALFGVTGAIIGASIDEGEDKDKAEQMASAVEGICCKTLLSSTLKTLEKSERFNRVTILTEEPEPESIQEYDAIARITIDQWGLRLIEQRRDMVGGFIELDMNVKAGPDRKTIWDERQVIVGQGREYMRKYLSDKELLQSEITQTIQEAGRDISNLLIYQ